jgi:hypothetical protein
MSLLPNWADGFSGKIEPHLLFCKPRCMDGNRFSSPRPNQSPDKWSSFCHRGWNSHILYFIEKPSLATSSTAQNKKKRCPQDEHLFPNHSGRGLPQQSTHGINQTD